MDDAKTAASALSVLAPTGSYTMHRIFTIERLFVALLRSLLRHSFPYGPPCSQGLGIPNPQALPAF